MTPKVITTGSTFGIMATIPALSDRKTSAIDSPPFLRQ
jgi:hypothetical protein